MALTSHDAAITAAETRFEPAAGLAPTAIVNGAAGEALGECGGGLTSEAFREDDLLAGRWDRAHTILRAVDWAAPEAASVILTQGELGEITTDGDRFTAELLGAAVKLQAPVCPVTSPECRASLGDKRCRIDLAGRRKRVTAVRSDGEVISLLEEVGEVFRLGDARWIRGGNSGLGSTVLQADGQRLVLREAPFRPVEAGDVLLLTEGCDKRLATCSDRFGNVVNFRGEPYLPGNDLLTRYPGS